MIRTNVIHNKDCLEGMKELPDNSIDAVVTDPPYELGFMNKKWDKSGIAYNVDMWKEVYRVLRPGGYLLSFGGTRTYHRMTVAIEDAGFIIHPQICWLFGGGFPKATNLSKQFDWQAFDNWVDTKRPKTNAKVRKRIWNATEEDIWGWKWCKIATERYGEIVGKREFVGQVLEGYDGYKRKPNTEMKKNWGKNDASEYNGYGTPITSPSIPEAKQWDGWYYGKQSLRPSMEPICMAQKPPEGRMTDNVSKHGTGGINVDDNRIGVSKNDSNHRRPSNIEQGSNSTYQELLSGRDTENLNLKGRFPSNTLLTHSPGCVKVGEKRVKSSSMDGIRTGGIWATGGKETIRKGHADKDGMETVEDWQCVENCTCRLLDSQSGELKSGGTTTEGAKNNWGDKRKPQNYIPSSTGGASRFFKHCNYTKEDYLPFYYSAKASKSERDKGLEGMQVKKREDLTGRKPGSAGLEGSSGNNPYTGANYREGIRNSHPTVKPLTLMKNLVKLITPPKGTVLDPFGGSGTTFVAALLEGFKFIGYETEEEYCLISYARLGHYDKRFYDQIPKDMRPAGLDLRLL